jgi:putative ABC transport system permease protein
MTGTILSALLSHWRRNPLQLITLLAGLALGTALWSGVQAINTEARASYDRAAATLGPCSYGQLTAQNGGIISEQTYVALRRAGWNVSPMIEGDLGPVRVIGFDPLTAPRGIAPMALPTGQDNAETSGFDLARFFNGKGQVFGRKETLARLSNREFEGIEAPDIAQNTVITDIGVAQRLLKRDGQIDRLIIAPDQSLTRRALSDVAPELIENTPQASTDVARLTDSFHLNLTAFGLLSFAVGLFIVHGAIGLAFEQRRPIVRTLRALGAPLRRLILAMALELLVLALVAGIMGVAAGYAVAALLLPDVAATLRGLYGADVSGQLTLRPEWWLSGLAIAVGGTAIAAAGALWSLARMPLLASAQPRAWAISRLGGKQAAASMGLLVLSMALVAFGNGLIAGFAMLAALLIGSALALPPLLNIVLRLGEATARGPVSQWFWADTRQQLPGLSLALMALLLAMAANVGVSTMVSSFRLTFTGFLDQRLASELYVSAKDSEQAAKIIKVAGGHASAILPVVFVDQKVEGQPAQIFGARDHATYRDNWQFLSAVPDVWAMLARGQGVLINEQLFRRAGLDLGSMVKITPGLSLPVLGIYGDYGNPVGQVIITETLFRQQFPNTIALRFGLRVPPTQIDALKNVLTKAAGVDTGSMIDQAAIKALSLSVFERTFTVTTALNILTLAVAGFAMLMSLLTLAAMRLPQLAPVWALGLTRRHLAGLDLLRAMLLAAVTGALALPLGLGLAWALLAIVNVEAFGWRLPMYVFPADYLRLGVFALLAAVLAALWPASKLWRMPPSLLLGVFRHER